MKKIIKQIVLSVTEVIAVPPHNNDVHKSPPPQVRAAAKLWSCPVLRGGDFWGGAHRECVHEGRGVGELLGRKWAIRPAESKHFSKQFVSLPYSLLACCGM